MPTYAPITWDAPEDRKYEYGVSKGVLFPMNDDGTYAEGEAWNGLVNVTDKPEGGEIQEMYADGILYAGIAGTEKYGASIEAYTYPDGFADCDGTREPLEGMSVGQQPRKKFGLCWRTEIGNANTDSLGYKIHVAYGMRASVAEQSHDTVNESPEGSTFSWDAKGTPVPMTGYKPTAKLTFDSTKLGSAKMTALEAILYGSTTAASQLKSPSALLADLQAVT